MAKQSFTKDERFMIQAYETAMLANDPELIMDRYDIGNKIGLQSRGVNTICNLLCQANFIKKTSDTEFFLTKHGEALALRLLNP